jgi:hypothetical protein
MLRTTTTPKNNVQSRAHGNKILMHNYMWNLPSKLHTDLNWQATHIITEASHSNEYRIRRMDQEQELSPWTGSGGLRLRRRMGCARELPPSCCRLHRLCARVLDGRRSWLFYMVLVWIGAVQARLAGLTICLAIRPVGLGTYSGLLCKMGSWARRPGCFHCRSSIGDSQKKQFEKIKMLVSL